jgi:3-deoxy-7-phosphoheptulonate synthase
VPYNHQTLTSVLRDYYVKHKNKFYPLQQNIQTLSLEHVLEANEALYTNTVLQIGDCAENVATMTPSYWSKQLDFYTRMGALVGEKTAVFGRFGGQFIKPRGQLFQNMVSGLDNKNSQAVLNYLGDGLQNWPNPELNYHTTQQALGCIDAFAHWRTLPHHTAKAKKETIWNAKEALWLDLEKGYTKHNLSGKTLISWHGQSTFLWIGYRSWLSPEYKELLDYVSRLANPLGIKIGEHSNPENLIVYIQHCLKQNPNRTILLINRFSIDSIQKFYDMATKLDPYLQHSKQTNHVYWIIDPMHGHTNTYTDGNKIRYINHLIQFSQTCIDWHTRKGIPWRGFHLEATFEDVAECMYQPDHTIVSGIVSTQRYYQSKCDPRLNGEQTRQFLTHFFNF